ncbi:hypothetical protein BN946_scf185015.g156 [Trametes cinnabarina]|uniref:Uncharacterized protein n=1 Tax=Pycnoporus cinnabarinus TaxID=5643 RepID=A0A060SH72_PYCCI|nr:hypothetical protein BN946_scf185015.g156 [Trametes cinnabarina]
MYTTPPRRGLHRKRLSALRLSSDSTVTTLPVYTSPPRIRHDLPEIPSEQPPAYSDSAEEADEDTDPSDVEVFAPSPPPSLPVSPRASSAGRNPRASYRRHRRHQSIAAASDPYLDSLLERSVHALEMSNALLQSSMSTQTSLSAVLADDDIADRSLEQRAHLLTSRIHSNRDLHESWMDDLDQISRGVEGLVRGSDAEDSGADEPGARPIARPRRLEEPVSQSLPAGGISERIQRKQIRRASQDFRQGSSGSGSTAGANLQLSAHDRRAFVAPAPRAITMYIDSSEAADAIALPATLGVRPTSRPPPTPLPSQTSFSSTVSLSSDHAPIQEPQDEERKRVVDMLASFVMPRSSMTNPPSVSSSPSSSSLLRRRDSSSSSRTVKKGRASKSPPPSLQIDTPSNLRSRSLTPNRGSPVTRQPRPLTPPIEELSTSSTSSDSHTLHVDRTVESLRQILEKQRSASQSSGSKATAPSSLPRPSILSPPTVAPVLGTSNATASVSRLFTKARHTTSTRPPSPPRQSSMKGRSRPSTPLSPSAPSLAGSSRTDTPTPSPSLLSVPDVFGGVLGGGRSRSGPPTPSGSSTPKRISFAEPLEPPYSSSKVEGSSSGFAGRFRTKAKSGGDNMERGRSRGKGKGKGKGKGRERLRLVDRLAPRRGWDPPAEAA